MHKAHIYTYAYIHTHTGTYTCVCAHTESKLEYMWSAYEHKPSLQQLTGRIIWALINTFMVLTLE